MNHLAVPYTERYREDKLVAAGDWKWSQVTWGRPGAWLGVFLSSLSQQSVGTSKSISVSPRRFV